MFLGVKEHDLDQHMKNQKMGMGGWVCEPLWGVTGR